MCLAHLYRPFRYISQEKSVHLNTEFVWKYNLKGIIYVKNDRYTFKSIFKYERKSTMQNVLLC